jgi:large subunit ribosomal protein L33
MSQSHLIGLACKKCKERNYVTSRNKKQVTEKLALTKFCKSCRTNEEHKEYKV